MNTVYDEISAGNWISRTAAIDYMVVAGGGGSGFDGGGGGGAGGYRASGYGPSPLQGTAQSLGLGSYTVTVGAGGAGEPNSSPSCTVASSGSNSVLGCITSAGGGGSGGGAATVNSADGGLSLIHI